MKESLIKVRTLASRLTGIDASVEPPYDPNDPVLIEQYKQWQNANGAINSAADDIYDAIKAVLNEILEEKLNQTGAQKLKDTEDEETSPLKTAGKPKK
jgi:DNA-binding IscR family transcriptional regulator